jgi:hypothetical protein
VQNTGTDQVAHAWVPFAMPQVRAQVAIRWCYLGVDIGYAISATAGAGDWSGSGGTTPATLEDMRFRGPQARLYTGLTL